MHASPTQLDSTLARAWQLAGDWSISGARAARPAVDPATGAAVLVEAVCCAADGMATAQLAREIGALECLAHHPAVVPLLDSGRDAGWLYLVTAWPDGATLRERIAREGAAAPDDAITQVIAIADLLHFAHSLGIVHGAISTATIVGVDGAAMLGRFGTATRVIADDARRAGVAADVSALAAVLYELVTGACWCAGARIPDAVPAEVTLVLHRALGTNRDARFPTAISFAQALVAARDGARAESAEVSAREAAVAIDVDVVPLSDGAERSLRVLHALLDQAEVAEQPPAADDPLVQRCWERALAQVRADDPRLIALRCRWRLLADLNPVAALAVSQKAPFDQAVLPYRARSLAALGRAAEARTLAVRSWFDDVALDLSALRSVVVALVLTRAFDIASLVSVAECAGGATDSVIAAAAEACAAGGVHVAPAPGAQARAIHVIATALERRLPWTAELLVDPRWDALRSDRRFAALLAESKKAWTSEPLARV